MDAFAEADRYNQTSSGFFGDQIFEITMGVLYLVVCVLGLAGNALVMVAMLKQDKLSSSTTVYIFNLALADGLFMFSLPFIASQNFLNRWTLGNTACKVIMILDGINQFTSVFCLTAMSIDRYMALINPLRFARWRTPRCAKVVSALLWLFSLLTILPMALRFSPERGLCIPEIVSDTWWLGILTYTFVLGFALPFVVMTATYTALLLTLRSQRLKSKSPTHKSQKAEQQVTRMVIAVVVVFGTCWLPFYTLNFWSLHQPLLIFDLALTFASAFEVIVLLSYSWSCANPILYACFSETFRKHFRALLCPSNKSPSSMHSNTVRYEVNDTCVADVTVLA